MVAVRHHPRSGGARVPMELAHRDRRGSVCVERRALRRDVRAPPLHGSERWTLLSHEAGTMSGLDRATWRSSRKPMAPSLAFAMLLVLTALIPAHGRAGDGDAERGAKVFGVCAPCHSLRPDLNMTGPSLAGVWGRKAGGLAGFD